MKKEERIREMIKENSKEVEVPQSLKPENILRKLEKKDKKIEKRRIYKWVGAMAAVLCLAVGFSMVYGNSNMSQYPPLPPLEETKEVQNIVKEEQQNSLPTLESYDVIYQALKSKEDEINNSKISYNTVKESAVSTESDKTSANTEDKVMESHTETNVQVQGIDEADIVKTDGEYLYATASGSMWNKESNNKINIVKADQGNMKKISTISVNKKFYSIDEIYVDKDKLIVIGQQNELDEEGKNEPFLDEYACYDVCYIENRRYTTYVTIYDIADKANPKKVKEYQQSGSYGSSRKIEDILYIFTNFTPVVSDSESKIDSYIPKCNKEVIECKDIYFQGETKNLDSVVVAAVSLKEPGKVMSKKAVYGGGSQFYVSENNIYIYWEEWKQTKTQSKFQSKSQTNITKLKYKDGELQGTDTCTIDGSIDDCFSMDEQDGYLRVVATCTTWNNSSNTDRENIKNNLYVLDEKLKISGQIKDLAPGETIQSARFLGDTGYFVTFRQTDPLFSVDLSNPKKPKILGELKVTGFSDYLHFWDENLLLGIGVEADENGREQGLKVSMFDISDPKNVKEIDRLVLPMSAYNCPALKNYKEVMVQLDKNRVGFTIGKYKEDAEFDYSCDYYIFTYEKEKGFSYKTCSISEGEEKFYPQNTRGIGIGDYLYVVIPDKKIVSFQEKENGKWNKVSSIDVK